MDFFYERGLVSIGILGIVFPASPHGKLWTSPECRDTNHRLWYPPQGPCTTQGRLACVSYYCSVLLYFSLCFWISFWNSPPFYFYFPTFLKIIILTFQIFVLCSSIILSVNFIWLNSGSLCLKKKKQLFDHE